jgi:UDP-N-acetylmuramoyl-tripeptide--D-alanyl-D-alanine ligase
VLFIPLIGEKFDGHEFITAAFDMGAAVVLTQKDTEPFIDKTMIRVEDTFKAFRDIAAYYKAKYRIPTVAVTGSVGKTTTKDMLYSALNEKYNTIKTPNNFNNEIGVPITVLMQESEHEAAVIETGMNHFGELERLAGIIKPDAAVITNIGMSHIENLGSQEGIFRAKMEIAERFTSENTLIVNGDDKYLKTIKDTPYKVVRFGMRADNDVYAKDIVNNGLKGMEFTVVHPNGEFRAELMQPGEHNIYNALAAVCAGLNMGVSETDIANGLKNCEYTASRLEIIDCNGTEIINDCYNSSPDSVRAALKVMTYSLKPRKVAVLGDILEMGEYAKDAHFDLGKTVSRMGVDLLITAGGNAKLNAQGAKEAGMENVISYNSTDDLKEHIKDIIKPDDCVLIKASHGMEFYKLTDALKN